MTKESIADRVARIAAILEDIDEADVPDNLRDDLKAVQADLQETAIEAHTYALERILEDHPSTSNVTVTGTSGRTVTFAVEIATRALPQTTSVDSPDQAGVDSDEKYCGYCGAASASAHGVSIHHGYNHPSDLDTIVLDYEPSDDELHDIPEPDDGADDAEDDEPDADTDNDSGDRPATDGGATTKPPVETAWIAPDDPPPLDTDAVDTSDLPDHVTASEIEAAVNRDDVVSLRDLCDELDIPHLHLGTLRVVTHQMKAYDRDAYLPRPEASSVSRWRE